LKSPKGALAKKESPMKGGKDIECHLTFEVVLAGERIVIPNLTGLKCSKCGEAAFDANSTRIIEKYIRQANQLEDTNARFPQ